MFPFGGPATDYCLPNGDFERIPENSLIRRFVQEHFDSLNHVVTRMRYSGGTFSGKKSIFIAREYFVLGYRCTLRRLTRDERLLPLTKHTPARGELSLRVRGTAREQLNAAWVLPCTVASLCKVV